MSNFDRNEAKKFLFERAEKEKNKLEQERNLLLQQVMPILIDEFAGSGVEVFLVGSLVRPYCFTSNSDVDIVLKNFKGDRFDIWTRLEKKIDKNIEIILFETCQFKEFVATQGLKVV